MEKRRCSACSMEFDIADEDLAFYQKVSPVIGGKTYLIPPPTLCYPCRQRRRLTWRNERTLYWRRCARTGRKILSTYSPSSDRTVYAFEEWFGDSWDPLSYGRDYDFNRPFFEQFAEFAREVPVPSLFADTASENSDYANLVKRNKNCYFIFAANDNEECFYSTYLQRNRSIADCFFIFDSELCYESIDCYSCYELRSCQNCQNCSSSILLLDCIGCTDCFCCVGLRNKQYHLYNQPYSKEEYQRRLAEIRTRSDWTHHGYLDLERLTRSVPRKYYAGLSNINVRGDHISFSKNADCCFDCTYLEDCKYCTWLHRCKDCYDHYAWGLPGELGYENHLVGDGFHHVCFCECCFSGARELFYCRLCVNNVRNLFGCIGLRQAEYCILNKHYSKPDYEQLIAKIIEQMQTTGEWGQFFPSEISPYCYNETVAQEYFPLTEAEVTARGLKWQHQLPWTSGKGTISQIEIPTEILAVPPDITEQVLTCSECSRNYRITTPELKLYQRLEIQFPRRCFNCRYLSRRNRRNSRLLLQRFCEQCGVQLASTFSVDQPGLVFCEECYSAFQC